MQARKKLKRNYVVTEFEDHKHDMPSGHAQHRDKSKKKKELFVVSKMELLKEMISWHWKTNKKLILRLSAVFISALLIATFLYWPW